MKSKNKRKKPVKEINLKNNREKSYHAEMNKFTTLEKQQYFLKKYEEQRKLANLKRVWENFINSKKKGDEIK
jgi:hypothetical protein